MSSQKQNALLTAWARKGALDARGLRTEDMVEGTARSTMNELAQATLTADRVLVF